MTREQWVMILSFVAGVLTLAGQFVNPSPDFAALISFGVAVINLALCTFFGVQVYRSGKSGG